jgi:hypothetical protein
MLGKKTLKDHTFSAMFSFLLVQSGPNPRSLSTFISLLLGLYFYSEKLVMVHRPHSIETQKTVIFARELGNSISPPKKLLP